LKKCADAPPRPALWGACPHLPPCYATACPFSTVKQQQSKYFLQIAIKCKLAIRLLCSALGAAADRRNREGLKARPLAGKKEKGRRKNTLLAHLRVCLRRHKSLMIFKAILKLSGENYRCYNQGWKSIVKK